MRIHHVKILTPEGSFGQGTVSVRGDRIYEVTYTEGALQESARAVEEPALQPQPVQEEEKNFEKEQELDGKGGYLLPGMIDLHFHGCKGYDFCDGTPEALREIARYEASIGVTGICPATMTLSVEELKSVLRNAAIFAKEQRKKNFSGEAGDLYFMQGHVSDERAESQDVEEESADVQADLLGINMEGPFISPVKRGAQDESKILPRSSAVFARLQEAAEGLVRFIAIAPEEPGEESVEEFIAAVRRQFPDTSVSLAHTNADYEQAMRAFDAGANHAVHLFNAMPALEHRAPGVVGAVSDSEHVMAEMICDGIHIHPAVVRAAFKIVGKDRLILISDSMRAAGMPDGRYTLGGLDVDVRGRRATMVRDGALAGSVTTLPDCVRTLVREMGIPLEVAAACATRNPARSLGADVEREYGTIEVGKRADLVLWDENLDLKMVVKDGRIVEDI